MESRGELMSVRVLVVDDSGFFRKRVCEILNSVPEIEVVGTAANGREGIELVEKLKPDVVTMDYEMPVMDGVTAVRNIMASNPTPILMFSSLTYEGARVTLDALEAGAVDFLPKNFEDIARDASKMQNVLRQRILALAKASSANQVVDTNQTTQDTNDITQTTRLDVSQSARVRPARVTTRPLNNPSAGSSHQAVANTALGRVGRASKRKPISHKVELVVIGTSTGGPVALQKIVSKLPSNFPVPVLLIQHMPATFTPAFTERLNGMSAIHVKHAEDGDVLKKGQALLAPGGMQMLLKQSGANLRVSILPGDDRLTYRPSVDLTFGSASRTLPGKILGLVLTGMGADGREGCRLLKSSGSSVWTQTEKSCVVYGMPMAVDRAGYSDASIDIVDMADRIIGELM